MDTGQRGEYYWLVAGNDDPFLADLRSFAQQFPTLIDGRYLAVTSWDSGVYPLEESQLRKGWFELDEIVYTPLLHSGDELPRPSCCGSFDEWYVLAEPRRIGRRVSGDPFTTQLGGDELFAWVNMYGWCAPNASHEELREMFWTQFLHIAPEAYVSDGPACTFVTKDERLFRAVAAFPWEWEEEDRPPKDLAAD